jgi:hypothetical protein
MANHKLLYRSENGTAKQNDFSRLQAAELEVSS